MTLPPDDKGKDDLSQYLGDGVDPIKWLESLAARQGAKPEEFMTSADMDIPEPDADAFVDEPGYVDYDPFGSPGVSAGDSKPVPAQPAAARPAQPAARPVEPARPAAPPPAQPEPVQAGPSAEIDPLAWLESLARRQGANPEEFVTEANLAVPEVPPDTVIDEPGYTPYDAGMPPARRRARPPSRPDPLRSPVGPPPGWRLPPKPGDPEHRGSGGPAGPPPGGFAVRWPRRSLPRRPSSRPAAMWPEPAAALDPLSGAVDPLAWLESLARRQGAKSEELITAANLDIPEADANAVVDEPGYHDYSPFASVGGEEEVVSPVPAAPARVPAAPAPVEEAVPSGGDTLAWLEGLAEEQGVLPLEAFEADPLAGLSEAEIEALAAEGRLSPEQMEAWLGRQAESLAMARLDEVEAYDEEPALPAEPGAIPAGCKRPPLSPRAKRASCPTGCWSTPRPKPKRSCSRRPPRSRSKPRPSHPSPPASMPTRGPRRWTRNTSPASWARTKCRNGTPARSTTRSA
jgi:hypothetical protein